MARKALEDGPHPVDMHVGRMVAQRRISLGYNQSDLAKALGLTFQQIQKYEKGSNRISASKLWDISGFLQVDIGSFFVGVPGGATVLAQSASGPEDVSFPATRHSNDIARLAPQLSRRQQKLAFELIRSMLEQATSKQH